MLLMKKSTKTAKSKELADLHLKVRYQDVAALKPYAGNARTHSDKQITQIAASIRNFGFNNPVLVDADNRIVAGHGRVEAAKRLGLPSVPTIRLDHLSDAERRAYVIADNRLAELAGWTARSSRSSCRVWLIWIWTSKSRSPGSTPPSSTICSMTESKRPSPIQPTRFRRSPRAPRPRDAAISGLWASIACCVAMRGMEGWCNG